MLIQEMTELVTIQDVESMHLFVEKDQKQQPYIQYSDSMSETLRLQPVNIIGMKYGDKLGVSGEFMPTVIMQTIYYVFPPECCKN